MKKILLFLIILFFSPAAFCQINSDSIISRLAALPDSQKARQANDLSFRLRTEDPSAAAALAAFARATAVKIENKLETGRGYYNEGNAFMTSGDFTKALLLLDSAVSAFGSINNQLFKAKALNSQGIIQGMLGNFKKAVEIHLAGLAIREKINDSVGIPSSLNNLGAVYQNMKEFNRALGYFQRALELHRKNNDVKNVLSTLSNIGAVYSSMQDFKSALSYHQEALKLCLPTGDEYSLAVIYSNIGADLIEIGKLTESIEFQNKGLALKKKLGDLAGETVSLINIGQCYAELKQYALAEKFLLEGFRLSKELSYAESLQNAHMYLSALYEKLGNQAKALFHYKQYTAIKDSLFNEDKARDIGKLEAKFEIEKAQEEQKRRQEDEQRLMLEQLNRRNRLQYSGIFLFIICLLIGAFVSGRFELPDKIVRGLIFFTFLLLFEFLLLLLEPGIESVSNGIPLFKLACNAVLALLISPVHSFLEEKMGRAMRHAE